MFSLQTQWGWEHTFRRLEQLVCLLPRPPAVCTIIRKLVEHIVHKPEICDTFTVAARTLPLYVGNLRCILAYCIGLCTTCLAGSPIGVPTSMWRSSGPMRTYVLRVMYSHTAQMVANFTLTISSALYCAPILATPLSFPCRGTDTRSTARITRPFGRVDRRTLAIVRCHATRIASWDRKSYIPVTSHMS